MMIVLVDASQSDLVVNILIFMMATFLGIELVRHVSRLLHTPLMALTNAISSVSFVAALIVLAEPTSSDTILVLVTVAVALAFTNIVSGFLLTERILRLFKRRDDTKK
ncbi:MAG: NAD(P) transhydrogenase subunit alpha [Nitrososphaerales archaeon]|jgi:NAD(P) transhydrogenase subunit alpha